MADRKYPSVSYEIADQIYEAAGVEVRVTVPGHTQRGGSHVHMTECSVPDLALQQHRQSLRKITAA